MPRDEISFTYENDDGVEITTLLPSHNVVCSCCRGNGTIVNPSIDGHGISREEFDEDPEFEEAYFAGRYDIVCPECEGLRVVAVPDWDRIPEYIRKAWDDRAREIAALNAAEEAERRFGC